MSKHKNDKIIGALVNYRKDEARIKSIEIMLEFDGLKATDYSRERVEGGKISKDPTCDIVISKMKEESDEERIKLQRELNYLKMKKRIIDNALDSLTDIQRMIIENKYMRGEIKQDKNIYEVEIPISKRDYYREKPKAITELKYNVKQLF